VPQQVIGFDKGLSYTAFRLLSCILSDAPKCRSLEEDGKARPLIRSICDVASRALDKLKGTGAGSAEELALTQVFLVLDAQSFSAGTMRDFMCSIVDIFCTCFEHTYVGQKGRTRLAGHH
jgi:hypothetical protein